jgi:hypothetical protein
MNKNLRDIPHEWERAEPKPKPATLVCVNGKIVGDAVVVVSSADPNWWRGMAVKQNGRITVRRY